MELDIEAGKKQKYVLLANRLGGQVEAGMLKPGDRLPSIADLRNIYGVSQPTAERAYAILERKGLVIRKPSRGFFVADWQRTRKQCVLGVSVPPKQNLHSTIYYERIVRGIRNVALEEQVELLFFHTNSVIRWEKVEGVILTTPSEENFGHLPQGMPAVSALFALCSGVSVVTNDKQAAQLLVEHLLSLGHRRIAFVTAALVQFLFDDLYDDPSKGRLQGYYETMRTAGIEPDPSWIRALRDPRAPMQRFHVLGREAMTQWLHEDWHQLGCTAILAHNDEAAIGIIDVLQDAGIRVPQDVSVVGFDGLDIVEYYRPRLTTIEVPLEEIGTVATRTLLEQIRLPLSALHAADRTQIKPQTTVLAAGLKIGDSSGPCPVP